MDTWKKMEGLKKHMFTAFALRVAFITYGEVHDRLFAVPYTDIDYRVFTDAARYTWEGGSPYDRFTYRYPPIIAWLLIPNLWFATWGKFLFSVLDLCIGWLIYKITFCQGCQKPSATQCALIWLYNPLSIVISTRGNSDSLSALLVLGSLLCIMRNRIRPVLAGILLGLAIHVRLYPLVFSLPMYFSLRSRPYDRNERWIWRVVGTVWPNCSRLLLTFSCCATLALCTGIGWELYGWRYLQESILFHLHRRDMRHNFSIYFYLIYLNAAKPFPTWLRCLIAMPQVTLLLAFAITFGTQRHTLPFCMFAQGVIMVVYNAVVTAQYFVWFMSLLPAAIPFLVIDLIEIIRICVMWIGAQCTWLIPAYMLEFRGDNAFQHVWLHSLAFFTTTLFALSRLVKAYWPPDSRRLKRD